MRKRRRIFNRECCGCLQIGSEQRRSSTSGGMHRLSEFLREANPTKAKVKRNRYENGLDSDDAGNINAWQ